MKFLDIFIGSDQSKYAGIAILVTLLMVALSIVLSKEKIPVTNKLVIAVLLFIFSLPGVLFSLFQLTCIVTGAGSKNQRWWCSAYAWFISILVILYCAIIVILVIVALFTDKDAKMVEQFYAQKEMFDSYTNQELSQDGTMSVQMNDVPPPPAVSEPVITPELFEDYGKGYPEEFEEEEEVVEHFTGTCGGPMSGGGSCGAPSW